MTDPKEQVELVALAITQEIGWGNFSHFNPDDMRRISRAAIAALQGSVVLPIQPEARFVCIHCARENDDGMPCPCLSGDREA